MDYSMTTNETLNILGFHIQENIEKIGLLKDFLMINTINPHCYCEAKKDKYYNEALRYSDVLIPDGVGIVWATRILEGKKITRITGADLHRLTLDKTNKKKGKVFYLGSAPSTLKLIEQKLKKEYANIQVASLSPPYKAEFTDEENAVIVAAINSFQPDVLFVGMTAPKQEKWAYKHKDQLEVKIIASIGAVFDFYAGTIKRPGIFWQKLGLEWLPRLLREPKRLWKRNFVSTPCFLWDVFKAKMGWIK